MATLDPFATLRHHMNEMKSSIELFLASGRAETFEDYHRMVGEYAAMNKIISVLDDIEKRYIES